jgi:hypothetical protein
MILPDELGIEKTRKVYDGLSVIPIAILRVWEPQLRRLRVPSMIQQTDAGI